MGPELFLMVMPLLTLLFIWASVTHWIWARAADRRMRERYALLRHLSEQSSQSVQLVLDRLREDDAREDERQRARSLGMRRGNLLGASTLMIVGVVLTLFLYMAAPAKPVWLIGLMPLLIGVALAAFAWTERPRGAN